MHPHPITPTGRLLLRRPYRNWPTPLGWALLGALAAVGAGLVAVVLS